MEIESLKRELSVLRDSARIDCLNNLSLQYTYLQPDTAALYAERARYAASILKYKRGMAACLNNSAHIAGLGRHNYPLQEKISFQAIRQYGNIPDKKILADSYMNLAMALFCQGYFERAREAGTKMTALSKETGDLKMLGETTALLGCIGLETGNYAQAFEYFNQALQLFKISNDDYNTAIILSKLGDLYNLAGDQKTALTFYFQSLQYPQGPSIVWHPLVDLGDTYYLPGPNDTALFSHQEYVQSIKWLTIRRNYAAVTGIRKAEMDMASKQYDEALALLKPDLVVYTKMNDKNQVMRILLDMARSYNEKKYVKKSLYFARCLLQIARTNNAKQYIRDACALIFSLYDQQRNTDSAYVYFRQYTYMKDSVAMDEFTKQLAMYKAATESEKKKVQIEILENEKLINQQQLKLSQQQFTDELFQKKILIAGMLVLALMGLIILRNINLKQKNTTSRYEIERNELRMQQLESETTKSELQQRTVELEMQALRAQMNPHFIFNSLNAINRFILQNNKEKASEYLTKFSRLIRLILQNSQSSVITLESELDALQVYLELEAVRFDDHFDFTIHVHPDVDTDIIKVPPLIIQPYAENAVWHGLMHKEERGNLHIDLYTGDDNLYCKITDDGIGRKKALELKRKSAFGHKSIGMQITASRIAMMQKDKLKVTEVKITDLVLPDGNPGGTEVILNIPICYD